MRARMERASRRAPTPRPASGAPQAPAPAPDTGPPASAARAVPPRPARPRRPRPEPARLAPDLAPVNLAIRVRRPLDDRLAELIHALRREGVRTSKVELIEMLLWELPEDLSPELRERLARFRRYAPRGRGAELADTDAP
jgi:hypothetical protein